MKYSQHLLLGFISIIILLYSCGKPVHKIGTINKTELKISISSSPFYLEGNTVFSLNYLLDETKFISFFDKETNSFIKKMSVDSNAYFAIGDTFYLSNNSIDKLSEYFIKIDTSYLIHSISRNEYFNCQNKLPISFSKKMVFVVDNDSLKAFKSGDIVWKDKYINSVAPSSLCIKNRLIISSSDSLRIYNSITGKLIYTSSYYSLTHSKKENPSIIIYHLSEKIIVFLSRNTRQLVCVDYINNKTNWRKTINEYFYEVGELPTTLPYKKALVNENIIWIEPEAILLIDLKGGESHKIKVKGNRLFNYSILKNNDIFLVDIQSNIYKLPVESLKSTNKIILNN